MKVDNIIILGGGTAGWMSAATLISQFPNKKITVIESPNIATVGVGESTLGFINYWLELLKIKDEDFMPFCEASYKLSIRFEDFYKKGDGGFHYPFGRVFENNKVGNKELWFLKKYLKPKTKVSNYVESIYPVMALVNNNTIFKNKNNKLPGYNFQYDAAYHFDATKFSVWLRDSYCLPKGVKHIQEEINDIQHNDAGIISLNQYKADLFIDCSGFKSILLGEVLKEPFNDYSNLLPNNKAWATRIPYTNKEKELKPYTNCTAIQNGWVWNIPCWNRIGTGYVYSDKYVSDEQALKEFKKHLDKNKSNYKNSIFTNIKMRTGVHQRLFVKNVCAIGLAAGFIEPLESNGLLSVHEFLINLLKIMQRGDRISQWDRDSFNKTCLDFFNEFTEFVAEHYSLSHRDDTAYWRDISTKSFYDSRLTDRGFKLDIEAKMSNNNFRSDAGLHCITTGMRYFARDLLNVKYSDDDLVALKNREQEIKSWDSISKNQLSLFKFLKKEIHHDG